MTGLTWVCPDAHAEGFGHREVAARPAPAFPQLDLTLHGGPLYPAKREPDVKSAGLQTALEAVLRVNAYLGVGLSAQYARLAYRRVETDADVGDVSLIQAAVVGRFTPLGISAWVPHLQLGIGTGDYLAVPACRFCSINDEILLSSAVGLEYAIVPRVRFGASLTAFLFALGVGVASVDEAPTAGSAPPAQSPTFPWLGLAPRISLTTVWESVRGE